MGVSNSWQPTTSYFNGARYESKDGGISFFQNVCSRKLLATATPRNPNNVMYYHLVIQIVVVIITLHTVLWFKLPTMTDNRTGKSVT
jgi:hypothetical protein